MPDRDNEARRRAMSAFAVAPKALLEAGWELIPETIGIVPVRGPEIGLVMLRGRIGGGGAPFNLGEASVTRASIRLSTGQVGHAMILGRDAEKARLAAAFDAAWQDAALRELIEKNVVAPAVALEMEADRKRAEETEATRVDFFTMVRGED